MKILFVSNTSWSMFNFRLGLLRFLLRCDCSVVVVTPYDEFTKKLSNLGCRVENISISAKGINPFSDLQLCSRLRTLYIKEKPDLIIHYTIKPNIYGSLAAAFAGFPSVAVTTGLGYIFLARNLVSFVAKMLYKFAFLFPKKIVFLNSDDERIFVSKKLVDKDKTLLLPGEGVDLEHFSPSGIKSNDNEFRFLLVARALRDKGIYEYVSAARIIKAEYPAARFQLLGSYGALNPSAISPVEIEAWQSEGVIDYLGVTDDVREAISQAQCVVLPSYREGVPRSLLEAAAMGKPIIATDVAGCRDVVLENQTGFLCPVKDAMALADCCSRMINLSSSERQLMGLAGRKFVEDNFSEEKVINEYIQILRPYGFTLPPVSAVK